MTDKFDFVVIGAGSAGAVIATRLTEDPNVTVCLIEAGGAPPPAEAMPAAVATLQNNPEVDWMFNGDAGGVGKGLIGGKMMIPRGKMLGGSSGMNYMAYVRGHPGNYDAWAAAGATGWAYKDVLPYFIKSEGLVQSDDIVIDPAIHGTDGPLGVSVRQPVLKAAQQFVQAAQATGMTRGDYNGRDRRAQGGVTSLFQTTTRNGKRSSTFHAYLEPVLGRKNLTVVTHAQVERIVLEQGGGSVRATGAVYRGKDGKPAQVTAAREVLLCAGAIGSPHLLMLSGIGPKSELAKAGVDTVVDLPDVGRHLRDHLHVGLFFPADGVGEPMLEVAMALGPDALRQPAGPLPANPADDAHLPPELAGLKAEAERRLMAWATTGRGIPSSSLYDAVAFFSTGLGDPHADDAEIGVLTCGYTPDIWGSTFRIPPEDYFPDPKMLLDPSHAFVVILPNPVQLRSEGSVTLADANPRSAPQIDLNYFHDPHDVKVMVAIMRRALAIAKAWPGKGLGELVVPPKLAKKHDHQPGREPSDALLEDLARHYALTVYHETSTCRIGEVVDPQLRVHGVAGLRVADASVMPNVTSGNTNATTIMIGEKAAEMIAADHGVHLSRFVGSASAKATT